MYINLLTENIGNTVVIKINRETKLNALNNETLNELSTLLDVLQADTNVKGVVITGTGNKAFVAGADIKEFVGLSAEEASTLARFGHEKVMDKIQHFSKPILAAINGFALGGGLELAMACHIRVASENAKMGLPEVSLGIIPGYGGTQRLAQLVGKGKALEMIMTADMIDASDAQQWGLINHIVSQENIIAKCIEILEKIYSRSSSAISFAIQSVNAGILNPEEGSNVEIELFGKSFESAQAKEGISAFLEKRKPNF